MQQELMQPRIKSRPNRGLTISAVIVVVLAVTALTAYVVWLPDDEEWWEAWTQLTDTPIASGVKLTFGAFAIHLYWDNITIVLSDGRSTVHWHIPSDDLDSGTLTTTECGSAALSPLTVYCNVTDLTGNAKADGGDSFTLTTGGESTFSSSVDYLVTLVYEPTDERFCVTGFSGQ